MEKKYNQLAAMAALTKAALKAIFRSPSAVVFSFVFPFVFILVFGFIGGRGGAPTYKLIVDKLSDTLNPVIDSLKKFDNVKLILNHNDAETKEDLLKGRVTGTIKIQKTSDLAGNSYLIFFNTTTASADKFSTFIPFLENIIAKIDKAKFSQNATIGHIIPNIQVVREYKTIDFILPGQLGFSLLSAGVFGVAFLFFNLRQTLVLKRFYATPISRTYIVLGEGIARVIFQLLTAIVIIGIGHFFFGFTLIHGLLTFAEIMVLSFIALLVFMGFGFIVSSVAKSESTIPPFANLITLPQFLLAGTFFPIDAFPTWLQPLCRILPLTHFNDAMRKIAFEGAHLVNCGKQVAILGLWGVVVYIVAVKVFKWE